jgi:hypothetical protein
MHDLKPQGRKVKVAMGRREDSVLRERREKWIFFVE